MNTMKTMLTAGLLLLPFAAQGDDDDCSTCLDCSTWATDVQYAIDSAVFYGRNADTNRSRLEAKLSAAEGKVTQDKFSDAIDKLDDISEKATDWVGASKPKLDDATDINGAIAAACYCVSLLEEDESVTP